ncbi:hypothetical protein QWJ34_00670 [Saccharibacillus sp. CPCC 101409]|uniref:hypothetical protein n=1 Tax=Saccharibacillus sp. CPCC 101409 TaxID=3058041 RepID=UPI0026737912|nr:hypothetical protein [Saccharibacillus sp. CPCC 101409]MDO3408271.1 hypothetical protein [Saccharibacillus sp. CPCC 101409]
MNRRNTSQRVIKLPVQGTYPRKINAVTREKVSAPTLGSGNDSIGTVIIKRKAQYKRPAFLK